MADWTPYKIQTPAADASAGIALAAQAVKLGGILKGDAQGNVSSAVAGTDYGYGLLRGNGPPGSDTAANLGQHYFDVQTQAAPFEYICVGSTEAGYVWKVYGDSSGGFQLKGRFLTLDALKEAISSGLVDAPEYGDAYLIGDTQPYDCYYYSKVLNDWENIGPLGATATAGTLPKSGTAGQVLIKSSDVDYAASWGDVLTDNCINSNMLSDASVTSDKLGISAKYSEDASVNTSSYSVGRSNVGQTLITKSGSYVLNIAKNSSIPVGAEIAVLRELAANVQIVFGETCKVGVSGEPSYLTAPTLEISDTFSMAAFKKIAEDSGYDYWLATGSAEVT